MFKNMTPSPFLRFYLGECGASLLWSRTVFSSICSSYCSSQVFWGTGSCKLILLLSPRLPIRWHTVAIVIWTLLVSSCPHMSYTTQASFSKFPYHTLLWCLHSCQFLFLFSLLIIIFLKSFSTQLGHHFSQETFPVPLDWPFPIPKAPLSAGHILLKSVCPCVSSLDQVNIYSVKLGSVPGSQKIRCFGSAFDPEWVTFSLLYFSSKGKTSTLYSWESNDV